MSTVYPKHYRRPVYSIALNAGPRESRESCLSVCLSNAWIVTKYQKVLPKFLYHTKDHLV